MKTLASFIRSPGLWLLILGGAFYLHVHPSNLLQITCEGAFYITKNGEEVFRNADTVTGVLITRHKNLWTDGAYIHWERLIAVSEPPMTRTSGLAIVRNGESGLISESKLQLAFSYEEYAGEDDSSLIFSPLTQTLHMVERKQDGEIHNFDGACENTDSLNF